MAERFRKMYISDPVRDGDVYRFDVEIYVMEGRNPVPDKMVTFRYASESGSATTDADGRAYLGGASIPAASVAGSIRVIAGADGVPSDANATRSKSLPRTTTSVKPDYISFVFVASSTVGVDYDLYASVLTENSVPIPGITIVISDITTRPHYQIYTGVTDADGRIGPIPFHFGNLRKRRILEAVAVGRGARLKSVQVRIPPPPRYREFPKARDVITETRGGRIRDAFRRGREKGQQAKQNRRT